MLLRQETLQGLAEGTVTLVVNVAVAWGCVTWAPLDQALTFFDVFPEEYGPNLRQIPGGPWTVVGTGKRYSGIGVHLERPPCPPW